MAKNGFEYVNTDGSVRIMRVVERLSDGTRVFEDGSRALPSKFGRGGEYVKIAELSDREYEEWNEEILRRISDELSVYYDNN